MKQMVKKISVLLIALFFVHIQVLNSQTISVAVAAGIRFAMDEIVAEFRKSHPDIEVELIYSSSGKLYQQIINHAPFDIYFSADNLYPEKLDSLHIAATRPELFAIGQLVLWSSFIDVSKGIKVLQSQEVKKIAIANPTLAPYGKRAVECLKYYNIYDEVQHKIVKGETVSQAAQFIVTGNADVGLIALSVALSSGMVNQGRYIFIDSNSYSNLEHTFVVLKDSETKKGVSEFAIFAGSEQARKIFVKYGFGLPEK